MSEEYQGPMISADGHVVEPADLWTSRMPKKWRDKAPHIENVPEMGDCMIIDGLKPRPIAFEGPMIEMKARGEEIPKIADFRYDDCRPGSWDPDERLKDQDIDGVLGEVVYPGVGLFIWDSDQEEMLYEVCKTYNDWLSEFCGAHPDRLKGAAILPTRGPIEWAVAEAERAEKLGLGSVMLPAWCDHRPYNQPIWDTLWARLEEMNMLCNFHLGGGIFPSHIRGPGASGVLVCAGKMNLNEPMQLVIWGGAPQRFPKMRWSIVEGVLGWIAAALELMDHWWEDHKGWMKPRLEKTPSEYFRSNFLATFEDDRAGVLTRELIGVDTLMWGADYPHTEGVWPFSKKSVASNFAGCPDEETHKIVCSNAADLYGFDLDKLLANRAA
ncbi:MAG: amidohydrolase family protein [Gammaproteobacteria bacterium]